MNKTITIAVLTLAMMAVCQSQVFATKYAAPKSETIKSENGKYTLITNPETEKHKIYASDDFENELWSFSLKMWHFPIYVSNDGKSICHLAWRHVKENALKSNCVTFRNADGIFKTYTFKDICPTPPKTQDIGVGPIGDFWRTWYNGASCKDDVLTVTTTLNTTYVFSLKDGSMQGGVTTKS